MSSIDLPLRIEGGGTDIAVVAGMTASREGILICFPGHGTYHLWVYQRPLMV